MVNCPGITAGAETGAALAFFRLYFGVTETTACSRGAAILSGAVAGAARQARDHHIWIAGKIALRRQRERDRDDAGEGQATALRDAIIARRQKNLAVLQPAPAADGPDGRRFAGAKTHQIAIESAHYLRHALRLQDLDGIEIAWRDIDLPLLEQCRQCPGIARIETRRGVSGSAATRYNGWS